ncbi:centrosomal protein of 131 kDa [Lontra canadensis]|uniref:centrosomal protein of 131 kDa n=1 Tax=Lontra canadensis TaxID=76717 RepID=UPI0013F2B8E2|nr:centrosomal protein of 131 kDa [Lontra canadensis]
MKGSRAASGPSGSPEGSSVGVDLSLTGLPPPVSRRPNSASAAKPLTRSFSVVTGSEPRTKVLEGPGGARTINNLHRSSSTTQVRQPPASQASAGPLRPAEHPHFLTLFEGGSGGKKRPAGVSKAPSEKGATWNVLDDQPRAFALPPDSRSPSTVDAPVGPRRRECTVPLAPSFTANNRSNKGAVGNCVTGMVHNRYTPSDWAPPPKSSNRTAPSLNNILKAAAGVGESSGSAKPLENLAGSNHLAQNNAGGASLRRKEVTEQEAERFIHQVNRAAVTIQRWYRQQVRRRGAGAAHLEHLLASKQKEQGRQLREGLLGLHQQKEAARKKVREEKARQARRAAIQELQQKRAQKSGDPEPRLLEDAREMEKPRPAQEPLPRPGGTTHAQQTQKANNAGSGFRTAGPEDPCQSASNSSPEPRQFPEDKPQDASSRDVASQDLEVVGPAGGRAKSRATLDELLDTLRLLEEEPEPLPCPRAYHQDKYSWTDQEDDASSLTADNLEKFGKLSACSGPPEDGTLLSEAKMQSILSFLHEMEMEASGQGRPASAPQGLVPEEGRLGPMSTASASVMRLKLEVEEKKQAVRLLQRALVQQRDLTVRRVKETEKELGRQLRQQRDHYEATIQRHLSFIDQLIEDKKALADRCEAVVAELKQGDQRRKDREAQVQEQHELEIKKLKELMSATEKVRREKWINEKTRKIKEITVRGLEPEIQKLVAKHKQEVKKLKSLHEAELLRADSRAAQRFGRQVEELREQLEQEKEALGRQERERAQQRWVSSPGGPRQDRRGPGPEQSWGVPRPRGRRRRTLRARSWKHQPALPDVSGRGQGGQVPRVAYEAMRMGLMTEAQSPSQSLPRLGPHPHPQAGGVQPQDGTPGRCCWCSPCAPTWVLRGPTAARVLPPGLRGAHPAPAPASPMHPQEAWLLNRERELREEVRRGRDKEIELVIHRLETDMSRAREESERAAESRVQRLRDQHAAELSELERAERTLQERCSELKGRLGEAEGESGRLRGLVRQKEKELAHLAAVNEQLVSERSGLAEVLRQEFADRLAASEEESRQLRARHRLELEQLTREKQAELEHVHGRVKAALAKKEEAVLGLRKQHQAAVKRAEHLEELLEQRGWPLPSTK